MDRYKIDEKLGEIYNDCDDLDAKFMIGTAIIENLEKIIASIQKIPE